MPDRNDCREVSSTASRPQSIIAGPATTTRYPLTRSIDGGRRAPGQQPHQGAFAILLLFDPFSALSLAKDRLMETLTRAGCGDGACFLQRAHRVPDLVLLPGALPIHHLFILCSRHRFSMILDTDPLWASTGVSSRGSRPHAITIS